MGCYCLGLRFRSDLFRDLGYILLPALNYLFFLAYPAALGIVGKIYASEIQPANTRAAASSVAQGLGFVSPSPMPVLMEYD